MRETRLSGSEGGVRSQSLIPTSIPGVRKAGNFPLIPAFSAFVRLSAILFIFGKGGRAALGETLVLRGRTTSHGKAFFAKRSHLRTFGNCCHGGVCTRPRVFGRCKTKPFQFSDPSTLSTASRQAGSGQVCDCRFSIWDGKSPLPEGSIQSRPGRSRSARRRFHAGTKEPAGSAFAPKLRRDRRGCYPKQSGAVGYCRVMSRMVATHFRFMNDDLRIETSQRGLGRSRTRLRWKASARQARTKKGLSDEVEFNILTA
jgi:hypothetical protein